MLFKVIDKAQIFHLSWTLGFYSIDLMTLTIFSFTFWGEKRID